jgi:hypothetical protein
MDAQYAGRGSPSMCRACSWRARAHDLHQVVRSWGAGNKILRGNSVQALLGEIASLVGDVHPWIMFTIVLIGYGACRPMFVSRSSTSSIWSPNSDVASG